MLLLRSVLRPRSCRTCWAWTRRTYAYRLESIVLDGELALFDRLPTVEPAQAARIA